MTKQTTRKTAIASVISLFVAYPALADVPNTFVSGTPATAASVNENFSNLDSRVSVLEAGSSTPVSVTVDCAADADALKNTAIAADTTYAISGACNGPIYVEKDNVHLLGSDNTADSIVLPSGLSDEGAVFAGGANNLQITDLFLDLTTAANNTSGLLARNSFVRIRDSRIEGGTWGINPFRGAIVRLDGENSITEFSDSGLSASDQSNINTRGQTTVTSTQLDVVGVVARRGSSIDVRGGITVSVPIEERAVRADSNSTITIRNSGIVSLTGEIRNGPNSSIQINGGTINGDLDLRRSSNLLMFDGTTITGYARLQDGATWYMEGGSITGNIDVRPSARLKMEDGVAIAGDVQVEGGFWTMVDSSISGAIAARVGAVIELGSVTQTSANPQAIDLHLNATLSAYGSTLGGFHASGNSAIQLDGGTTVSGGELHSAAYGFIDNASSTGDIAVFPPAATQIANFNLNGNNLYACGTQGWIDFNSVSGIANAATAASDCRP